MLSPLKQYLYNSLPEFLIIKLINCNPKYLIKIKRENDKFLISSNGISLYLGRAKRLYKYKLGIEKRYSEIIQKYFINEIKFKTGDIVVDIGANIGELGKAIRTSDIIQYIAIEPDPIEFEILKKNTTKKDILFNTFLSNEVKFSKVRYANDTGDTHLFTLDHGDDLAYHSIPILTNTLDNLLLNYKSTKFKLLKIEAEGSEPEILLGAINTLNRTEYVSVDTSPERGTLDTFDSVFKILTQESFILIKNDKKDSAIFQKIREK
jgi:FkbM family methyltransferase